MDTTQEAGKSWADNYAIGLIPVSSLDDMWPMVMDVVNTSKRGILDRHDPAYIYNLLKTGDWQLWVAAEDGLVDLVCFARLEKYTNEDVYRLIYVGGAWSKYIPQALYLIERFVMTLGNTALAFDTRKGFARRLEKYGYKIASYELKKTFNLAHSTRAH